MATIIRESLKVTGKQCFTEVWWIHIGRWREKIAKKKSRERNSSWIGITVTYN